MIKGKQERDANYANSVCGTVEKKQIRLAKEEWKEVNLVVRRNYFLLSKWSRSQKNELI